MIVVVLECAFLTVSFIFHDNIKVPYDAYPQEEAPGEDEQEEY